MIKVKTTEAAVYRDILAYGLTGMLRYLVPFLLLPFYTHFLDQNEFASLDLIISASAIVTLCVLEFNSGYARYFYQHVRQGNQADFYQTMLYIFLLGSGALTLLLIPVGFCLAPVICPRVPQASLIVTVMVAILFPQIIMEYSLINLRLLHRKTLFGILVLADSLVKGILSILFIAVLKMGLMGYALSVLLSYIGMAIWGTLYCRRIFGGEIRLEMLRKVLKYVLPMLPGDILGYLNDYGGRFIILTYLDLQQVAIYGLAARLTRVTKMCLHAFTQAWQPVAMEHITLGDNDTTFARMLDRYTIISLFVLLVGGLASKPIVALMAPPSYADAARLLPFLFGATLLSGSTSVLEVGNQAAAKTHWKSLGSGISLITNYGIALLLISQYGVLAVAMGMIAGTIARAAVSYFTAQLSYHIAYRPVAVSALILGLPVVAGVLTSCSRAIEMSFRFLR